MSAKLNETELSDAVATLPQWNLQKGELIQSITFADFKQAMDFVNRIAILAEGANHHPDIDIRYNRVRLALMTHDAGGITRKDIQLAEKIDRELSNSRVGVGQ